MGHLSLHLLGGFQATFDREPITQFESSKVRALLAYLAVEADRPHTRERLAGLLWSEFGERRARSNLRYALSNLRKAVGDRDAEPPFLLISNEALQFNRASDYMLDVDVLEEGVRTGNNERLQHAVGLYRGPFLEGFSLPKSAAFEEWLILKREQLGRQVIQALCRLADHHEARGEYEQSRRYAHRQVELEPWLEEGHRQLMRVLALGGERSQALAQYERCRQLLAQELDVDPAAETDALYRQIRDGTLAPAPAHASPATLLEEGVPSAPPEPPLFVAREAEIARLTRLLERAHGGQGQVTFVTGEAGSGKTLLIQEFARRTLSVDPHLIAAGGSCNAYTGIGDPYLPFREMLQFITGDVERSWARGVLTQPYAQRLWALLPAALDALLAEGAELIDRFVSGTALLARARSRAGPQAARLDALLKQREAATGERNLQQNALFNQFTKVLQALAHHHSLLLLIDDLQWADAGSISLLFHLGRRLKDHRILLVGAYRPGDVTRGRAGERHPLLPVINELQRDYGNAKLDLAQAPGRHFVDAFLDAEPNCLDTTFRDTLYRHTGGHPLFTVELVRGLQERGELRKDAAGRWFADASLTWEILPPRVEAVIAERIERLPASLRRTLAVASVEGEAFTAQAVARVLGSDEQTVIGQLSGPLNRIYRLVQATGVRRAGETPLSSYRFRHFLFRLISTTRWTPWSEHSCMRRWGERSRHSTAIAPPTLPVSWPATMRSPDCR